MDIPQNLKSGNHSSPLAMASWIWKASDHSGGVDEYLCFRRSFVHNGSSEEGYIDISVDSDFVLYLNEREIGRGQFSDFSAHKTWSRFELHGLLRNGGNLIAVSLFHRGQDFSDHQAGPGGLIFALQCGSTHLVSDTQWRCALHSGYRSGGKERMTPQSGFTFHYDARLEEDWTGEDFDDSGWASVVIKQASWIGAIWKEIVPRPLPHLIMRALGEVGIVMQGSFYRTSESRECSVAENMARRALCVERPVVVFNNADFCCTGKYRGPLPNPGRWISPGSNEPLMLHPPASGADGRYIIVDLGAQTVGLFEFEVKAVSGTVVEIAHGEHLEDGRVRASIDGRNFADSYVCGVGRRRFQMPFRRLGCRYLEVHFSQAASIYALGIRPLEYPTERMGVFQTCDPMAARLHEMATRTLELCRHEHYEDSPWREQALYGYDGRLQALYGYTAFGDYRFAEVSLSLLGQTFAADGFLALTAPGKRGRVIPIFTFTWISAVAEHWLYSGSSLLFEHFGAVIEQSLEKAFSRFDVESGLYLIPEGDQYWNFYDWTPGLTGEPSTASFHAAYNLFLHEGVRLWSWMLDGLGRTEQAETLKARLALLRDAFDRNFWSASAGLYESFHPPCGEFHEIIQILALSEGFGSYRSRERIVEAFISRAPTPGMLSGKYYLMRGLMEHSAKSRQWLLEHLDGIWQDIVLSGTSCLWETSHGASDFGFAGSLCHGWSALPIFHHYSGVLGVSPLAPGFKRFAIRVNPGRFHQTRGRVPTPYGNIEIEWERRDNGLKIEAHGPRECRAELIVFPEHPVASAYYNEEPLIEKPIVPKAKQGFSLVELLVVMAIIAVLAVLLSTVASRVVESSRSAKCAGNLRQIAAGVAAYAGEHNMALPMADTYPTGFGIKWYDAIGPYFQVPAGKILTMTYLRCPSAGKEPNATYCSYAPNYRYVFFVQALEKERLNTYPGSMRLNQVPASAFLFGDSGWDSASGSQSIIYSPMWWTLDKDTDGDGIKDSNSAIGGGSYNWVNPRHGKAANFVFADGSVRRVTIKQWITNDNKIWGPDLANP